MDPIPSPADRSRVNVAEPRDLLYWAARFNVTPEVLRKVVVLVGEDPRAVSQRLSGR